LTNRWGSRRTLLTAAVMFSVANVLVGIGPAVGSVGLLSVGILISSSSYALSNVPMNLETVVIERAMGRAVVPQFHAAFSIGSVTGSLIGAGVSWMGVPVVWHFVALSAVTLLVRAILIPGAVLPLPGLPAGVLHPTSGHRGGMRTALAAWREPRTLVIGLIVMVGALSEGSANNWMTIAVVDGFVQTEAVAAVVFGVFVGSMTVARLLGTSVIERFGRARVLIGSAVSSAIGLALFGLAPSLLLAAVGAVGWGLGAGLVVPIGMASVSGDRLRTAGRVAVISAFGSLASIVAPPMLGIAAEVMGIRHALLFIGGGFLLSIALARTVETDDAVPLRSRPLATPPRAPRRELLGTEPAAPEPAVVEPAVVEPAVVGT
jgi:MFS family permease